MRGDRLLSILLQLQAAGGRVTAGELAERLEVSVRTIHRDVDALSGAGIPVYADRGRGGGISLLDDFRTDLTGLTEQEARALFSFGGPVIASQLGLGPVLEGALRKLLAALPEAQRTGARRARERLLVDPEPWRRRPEPAPHLDRVQDAAWSDERLRIAYRRGNGERRTRTVDPYGLIAKAGVWYLLAAVEGGLRTYRVDRIEGAEGTGERFHRPAGFDLAAEWTARRDELEAPAPGVEVTVAVRREALRRFTGLVGRELTRPAEQLHPTGDGRPRLRLSFRAPGAMRAMLLAFGREVEAIAPAEVRAELGRAAASIAAMYEGRRPERVE
jgi:predicted DNA-binding transcriptional regulator YafY